VKTPIEELIDAATEATEAEAGGARIEVDMVLVPEQCASIFINGKQYHVTIEEIK